MRKPDFENMLKVLRGQAPNRPTLFELFLNDPLYERLAERAFPRGGDDAEILCFIAQAFAAAGYDYATTHGSSFTMGEAKAKKQRCSCSLNDGASIIDWETYEQFLWHDPDSYDYSRLEKASQFLPEGMKLMVMGPGGVLENVTSLVGFDNLCLMLYDDPALAQEVFDQVGSRLLRYYENCVGYDAVGFLCSNDDWGFRTQTFLSPADMRRYVFPWHKKIVDTAHRAGKPCILHSCGYFDEMIDATIGEMHFDAKHSYEDNICSVEDCYEKWHGRIAVLGGMDVDFLIRSTSEEIRTRCRSMLERTMQRGGYALGSGNSIPSYMPQESYFAMLSVIDEV